MRVRLISPDWSMLVEGRGNKAAKGEGLADLCSCGVHQK